MNFDDLESMIKAILLRHDGRWITPSGAFLDLLKEFALDGKLEEISQACQLYFATYPGATGFVSAALPAMILNKYEPLTVGVSYPVFLEWADQNKNWSDKIRDHASRPELPEVVEEMRVSLQKFIAK